jgi:hypothetical protein
MKKLLLASFVLSIGIISSSSAASIPGRIDGDLYFHDNVHISSGVTYQSELTDEGGSSTVTFDGEGSLTVGKRLGNGFPRIVLYGGTTLTVSQAFEEGGTKNWWVGDITAPNEIMNIPNTAIEWENSANHNVGGEEANINSSFGFGAYTDTYGFSSTAYLVLPMKAPNGAKVWYAFHNINTDKCNASDCGEAPEPIIVAENDFCIVQDNLCVIEVEEVNQISLVEESFEKCPRDAVANGEVGKIPYCIITCDEGYSIDENAVACIENNLESEEGSEESVEESSIETGQLTKSNSSDFTENVKGAHYRGGGLKLNMIDTTDLEGKELRNALRRNAELTNRMGGDKEEEVSSEASSLSKIINDIQSKLWSWENRKLAKNTTLVSNETTQEIELNEGSVSETGESKSLDAMHSAAPLLPSTGSSVLFIIISILGISLMMFAFKR